MADFLSLPTEIRRTILQYVIPEERPLRVELDFCGTLSDGSKGENPSLPLMLVCKQLLVEVVTVSPNQRTLHFHQLTALECCMLLCPTAIMQDVTKIHLTEIMTTEFRSLPDEASREVLESRGKWHRFAIVKTRFEVVDTALFNIDWSEDGSCYRLQGVWEVKRARDSVVFQASVGEHKDD